LGRQGDCMEHSEKIQKHIEVLREDERSMLHIVKQLVGTRGAPMFPLDFLAYGALKRNLSTSSAIILLVEHFNLQSARSLLRVHIDTALRFAAAWFVDEPHDFASAVQGGARIDQIKDRAGKRLSDARLVELLSPAHPWLPEVYKNLSGFVHFSGSHVFASITGLDEETRGISFHISKRDEHYPEFSWLEVLRCAHESTGIFASYLLGYVRTKAMSKEELKAYREKNAQVGTDSVPEEK
jgi:hypothetical protein